ncbi:Ig-like domain-containing protein [Kangiella marina]|uniref:Cadherin domain-containing protein n=1 Tax=Kangiella marina TaxID=1079178 RepID=A0ABP8IF96_9GAMM
MNTFKLLKYLALSSVFVLAACSDSDSYSDEENQPPVASKLSIMTVTDTPVMEQLEADDPDGDALTFTVINQPQSGTVELSSDGSFTYTPDNEFTGTDLFTFVASDGEFNSATTEVDITVNVKQEVFSSYSRESYQRSPSDDPSGVNGREFIFDVTTTDTYQDLVQDGEQ